MYQRPPLRVSAPHTLSGAQPTRRDGRPCVPVVTKLSVGGHLRGLPGPRRSSASLPTSPVPYTGERLPHRKCQAAGLLTRHAFRLTHATCFGLQNSNSGFSCRRQSARCAFGGDRMRCMHIILCRFTVAFKFCMASWKRMCRPYCARGLRTSQWVSEAAVLVHTWAFTISCVPGPECRAGCVHDRAGVAVQDTGPARAVEPDEERTVLAARGRALPGLRARPPQLRCASRQVVIDRGHPPPPPPRAHRKQSDKHLRSHAR